MDEELSIEIIHAYFDDKRLKTEWVDTIARHEEYIVTDRITGLSATVFVPLIAGYEEWDQALSWDDFHAWQRQRNYLKARYGTPRPESISDYWLGRRISHVSKPA